MCGIFGYNGQKQASKIIFTGLKRLEYRGYDSWGLAIQSRQAIAIQKQIGELPTSLSQPLTGTVGIGHTRWATHGGVSKINAHPHLSADKSFAVAHNGIVENYQTLQQRLQAKGHTFRTQTDTEVILRLIEEQLRHQDTLFTAVTKTLQKIRGRNTFILLEKSGRLIAAKNGSPLIVGFGKHQSVYFSSDMLSLSPFVTKVLELQNGQVVAATASTCKLYNLPTQSFVPVRPRRVKATSSITIDKQGYNHFMIKEIHDTPYALQQVILQPQKPLRQLARAIKKARHVYTIGSGSSGIAAHQIAFYLQTYAHISASPLIGAESTNHLPLINAQDLVIAPSQSGETADVLEVIETLTQRGVPIASYVNMPGSSLTRLSTYPFMINAGPEMCVMATKVFTAKLAWGYLLAKTVAGEYTSAISQLRKTKTSLSRYLQTPAHHRHIKKVAKQLIKADSIFILGKAQNLAIAREGMVKIIEGTYIHAHAIPAGDLKHYAITIIDKSVPVIVILSPDATQVDCRNAISEVKARRAHVIAVAPNPITSDTGWLPAPKLTQTSAIGNIIPLQLLSYYMTVALGNNVDKPRHIAKSVTVR